MKTPLSWSSRWIFALAVGFLYGAAFLRSFIHYRGDTLLYTILILAGWLVLFLFQPFLTRRWAAFFPLYLVIQALLTIILLHNPDPPDYFAVLFAVLSLQTMQHYRPRSAGWIIAGFTLLTMIALIQEYDVFMGIFLGMMYAAANALLASYALAVRRSQEVQARSQALLKQLQETNLQLQASNRQQQVLAVARERNRLGRELHDSVTQTVFSMTLSTQSALVLLDKDPSRVTAQLDRLDELAQGALAEMQVLITELRPQPDGQNDLAAILRRHLATRRLPETLKVTLDVGEHPGLSPAAVLGLARIVQEALNNIEKHAGASQVFIRLASLGACWRLEIEDNGRGFNPELGRRQGGVGLSSMKERAAEIGWNFEINSAPGSGTRIWVEQKS
jgi:signal transduction histidine kinase